MTRASTRALATGADSSSNGSSSSSGDHNSRKMKKRPRDSKVSSATVVISTDSNNFRAKVHKLIGMPTQPPGRSRSEESEKMHPLVFKPRARKAGINAPLTATFPFLSSLLSTNCSYLPLTDHLDLKLPVIEGDSLFEAHLSNSMLQLPSFTNNKAANSVSLQFKELLEDLELTDAI